GSPRGRGSTRFRNACERKTHMIRADYAKWLARGHEHEQAGRPIDAMVCYRRAINSNKHSVEAQYRLGQLLRGLGRNKEARAAWRGGLALSPGGERLLLGVAGTARRAGAGFEAIDAFLRILWASSGAGE